MMTSMSNDKIMMKANTQDKNPEARILIVDDDPNIRNSCKSIFQKEGYETHTANDGLEALEKTAENPYDIVILDMIMPRMDGMETLKKIKVSCPYTAIIMITGYATVQTAVQAIKEGAYNYLPKPFTPDEIRIVVKRAVDYINLQKINLNLQKELAKLSHPRGLIGDSPKLQEVYALIRSVAKTKSTVVIYGESGTGKELVAREIHNFSPRKKMTFIPVNCGSLSESLLESELFGHIKGAFTGAYITKRGLFEVADGGTIFLDEIGDISLAIQGKLLRVLQEKEFIPVGGTKPIKVDVRLIAATNKDLEKGIRDGTFREDLFYRLNIVPIYLPPLRERIEDIPALAYHFLNRYARENGKNVTSISNKSLQLLMLYNWPGNVRELENAIERAVIITKHSTITPELLPLKLQENLMDNGKILKYKEAKKMAIDSFEKKFLEQNLLKCQGNVSQAARLTGIERRNFQRLLRKQNIKSEEYRTT